MGRFQERRMGTSLAKNEDDKNEVKETYSPDEPDQIFRILRSDEIDLTGTLEIIEHTIDDTAFILDHPTQSALDQGYKLREDKYDNSTTLETQNF